MVTERIMEQLEKGVIPWQKPWTGTKNGAYNRVSRKPYSVLNQMLPCKEQYRNIEEFYSTLFHEMIHSTGHYTRLNRLESGESARFGSAIYSKEELIAEVGSAMILNRLGIETEKTFNNSTAYIQSWLRVLRNDNKFIVSASSRAEKAEKYIMNEDAAIE